VQPVPASTVIVVRPPLGPDDAPALCRRLREVVAGAGADGFVICDVGALTLADETTLEALTRLQLVGRRLGVDIRLRNPSRELVDLLGLVGLSDVFGVEAGSGLEPERQVEEREQPLIHEEVDPGDATV